MGNGDEYGVEFRMEILLGRRSKSYVRKKIVHIHNDNHSSSSQFIFQPPISMGMYV